MRFLPVVMTLFVATPALADPGTMASAPPPDRPAVVTVTPTEGSTATPEATARVRSAAQAWADCLRSHLVTPPATGTPQEAADLVIRRCAPLHARLQAIVRATDTAADDTAMMAGVRTGLAEGIAQYRARPAAGQSGQ